MRKRMLTPSIVRSNLYSHLLACLNVSSYYRCAVVGNVDAGKSTLLGVLTHGELDNGRGYARQKLFRHKHEAESGRTSSVGNDILGFDSAGQVSTLIVTSSAIDKMFQIFGPIFEQNANVNLEPIIEQNVNFGPIFKKMQILVLFL